MDLQQHREIILKWINSCDTSEQLVLLKDIVQEFIVKRFTYMCNAIKGKEEKAQMKLALELVEKDLIDAIIERNLIIAGSAAQPIPTAEKERPT